MPVVISNATAALIRSQLDDLMHHWHPNSQGSDYVCELCHTLLQSNHNQIIHDTGCSGQRVLTALDTGDLGDEPEESSQSNEEIDMAFDRLSEILHCDKEDKTFYLKNLKGITGGGSLHGGTNQISLHLAGLPEEAVAEIFAVLRKYM